MIDRANIGRVWPSWTAVVEKGRLRLFAKAIGETRPVYLDEAAARAAGHRSLLAPPTFAYCLRDDDPRGIAYLDEVGVPVSRLLHGEEKITLFEPICAGDRLTLTRRVTNVTEKKGGALTLVDFELDIASAEDGRLMARSETVLVVKNG